MEGAPRTAIAELSEAGADRSSADQWYNVLGDSSPGPNQSERVRRLAAQNDALIERLDALTRAQERHEARCDVLESKIDRLCDILTDGQLDERQALEDAICQRIAESMKPFFLAIVDLLELSMRRAPTPSDPPSEPRRPSADRPLSHRDEKLDGGLPPILTRPLDELIEADRGQARPSAPNDESKREPARSATAYAAHERSSAFSWTPVIAETSKR